MSATQNSNWTRFQQKYTWFDSLGLGLDFSRTNMPADYPARMRALIDRAFTEMRALESGAIANLDEGRMVGHYWLRNPQLAPTPEIRGEIESTIDSIKRFASDVHSGTISGSRGRFTNVLLIGIGGSALGPQFVSHALGHPKSDKVRMHFMDNTDPDGFDRVLAQLEGTLGHTLSIVVSKSGGTKETRNAMVEVEAAYRKEGLSFGSHAVAITSDGSELSRYAKAENWIIAFPMWDWVGGRTSELSAVGLLPAALQGFDINALIAGARVADNVSRTSEFQINPAMQLALFIHYIVNGVGSKAMVILPYKDRLELFSRYLQQLIMESLGKGNDRDGRDVRQGLTVFGNKGSTDQHAYVQQLRDGLENFFGLFIWVLRDREGKSIVVEGQATSGDYLAGFLLGTRDALFERSRECALLTLTEISAFSIGVLIALFERSVGFYASFINVNAYHQPGVEAGKIASAEVLKIQQLVIDYLSSNAGTSFTAVQIASVLRNKAETDIVFRICEHLALNERISGKRAHSPAEATFSAI